MNSEFSNTPEDRLIDELLHEQARGPDEAFLQQIESAVDAGTTAAPQAKVKGNFSRFAIAASVLLAAGSGAWWWSQDREVAPQVAIRYKEVAEFRSASPRKEIIPGDSEKDVTAANDPILARGGAAAAGAPPNINLPTPAELKPNNSVGSVVESGASGALADNSAQSGAGTGSGGGAGMPQGVTLELRSNTTYRQRKAQENSDAVSAADSFSDSELEAMAKSKGRTSSASAPGSVMPSLAASPPSDQMSEIRASMRSYGDAAPEPSTGDRYGTFIDQPWKSPSSDPLSTFSIDVDTASYSNVRRMIREGREIPKDAVRIEECINAFKYHYPAPKGDAPFSVGGTLAVCPWAPTHQLVRVAIKGRDIETNKRPASNLVFLIDVSGSMQSPDKLPLLQKSMETMVGQLGGNDKVAIVVYAGTEGVVLPSTRIDDEGRAKVLTALSNLSAGGSTNGGAGIRRAYEIAMEQKIEGGVNRVILATDGDFNVGVTGQQSLVSLVKERAQSGVYLTVAGFGSGNLNDAMMDAITHDGNGNYFYIDSEREGRKVFLQNLSGTLVTIAKDVKIQVEFNPAKVGGYRLIGYANRVLKNEDFNNDKVDAGDIGAGHTVTAFYELTPSGETSAIDGLKYQAPAAKPATDEWLTVKLRYKHPDGDESSKIEFPLTGDALALDKTDTDFQFATAAALFGMKLHGMEEANDTAWGKVLELAKPGLADDTTEDRAEFVELVKKLGHVTAGESGSGAPEEAKENNEVDGPDVRVLRDEDGSRTVFIRRADQSSLIKRTYLANGALAMVVTYRMNGEGRPMGCKIKDAQGIELFKVAYGYHKVTGQLVEELIFDSRVKRIDPDTGKETPIQKVSYIYDADGKRSLPIVFHLLPGISVEKILGRTSTALEHNPFDETEGKSGGGNSGERLHPISPPAEVIPPLPPK